MELEGSLKAFSLPEILQFLAMGKLTGTLMVRHDQSGIDLVIRGGRIVNSATFDHSRRLGQMLVHRRLILRSILDELLYDQKTAYQDKMLGQLLVERELISEDDLRAAIKAQLEEEIWELFSWETGEFRFEHQAEDEIRDVMVEIDVEPLIIEGTRRIDEWKAIIRNLRGDDTVLALKGWQPEERQELTLTAAEWQVLSLVNGVFSIGSIASRAGIGKFESYRILNAFLNAGICEILEEPVLIDDDLDDAVTEGAPEVEESAPAKKRNFFGKRRGSEITLNNSREESFFTALGLVARFINLTVNNCMAHRDFSPAAGDERLLEREWKRVLMDYPMADLVRVEGNVIDAGPLERYMEIDEEGSATLRSYEDAIEAMRSLYGGISAIGAQRMGEKPFHRIIQSLQSDWLPRCQIEHSKQFDFAKFLSRSLPIAQGVM